MGKVMHRAVRFRPQRVLRAADQLLETQRIRSRPAWHATLQKVPPSQLLVRPVHQQNGHHTPVSEEQFLVPGQRFRHGRPLKQVESRDKSQLNALAAAGLGSVAARTQGGRSAQGLYKPKRLAYEEDGLRDEFFGDHPWELARPKVVLETGGGRDARDWDWGRGVEQPGKQLDGESVVQRQKWLMKHPPFPSEAAAYDLARKEFYRVRRQDEIRQRVAAEEARAVGAVFGPSMLDVGMRLEDEVWDRWRELAGNALDQQEVDRTSQALNLGIDPDQEVKQLQQEAGLEQQGAER